MSGHTPGPWRYCTASHEKGCTCGLVWALPADEVVAIAQGERNSETGEGFRHEVMVANARLIASAPALLEALERLDALLVKAQRICERSILPGSDTSAISPDRLQALMVELLDGPEQRVAQSITRTAIAAARGEEPKS